MTDELAARRLVRDGGGLKSCTGCGSVWLTVPAVTIDPTTGAVTGYALPVACAECDLVLVSS